MKTQSMPKYKLVYFDVRGRGELARLLFALSGQDYEDHQVYMETTWKKEKKETHLGQVPVLYIDGVPYGESVAITNYLAREFGLYGKTSLEMLAVDEVIGITQDFFRVIVDYIHAKDDPPFQEKLKQLNEEKYFPMYLAKLEKLLEKSSTGYFVGKEITYADIAVFDALDIFVPKPDIAKCPLVKADMDMVRTHDKLKDYIATRKDAVM